MMPSQPFPWQRPTHPLQDWIQLPAAGLPSKALGSGTSRHRHSTPSAEASTSCGDSCYFCGMWRAFPAHEGPWGLMQSLCTSTSHAHQSQALLSVPSAASVQVPDKGA